MVACRLARCRQRFVVPVIFLGNKVTIFQSLIIKYIVVLMQYICRSATLASTAEIIGRTGMEWIGQ